MKFLLVEDDQALASAVKKLLVEHHYVMDLATDGEMGKEMADIFPYDLILLDWTLPKLEGIQLCKHLREAGNYTPIILMTSRDASTDRVAGLDAGADDYLIKPFGFEELLARIRALLRRAEGLASPILQWGDLSLDPSSSQVTCRSVPVPLTPKEYALLELFLRNPSRIFSLDSLLDKVWTFEDSPGVGSVRTHIKGLRHKLKKAGLSDVIGTVYGLGYRLKSAEFFVDDTKAEQRSPFHENQKEINVSLIEENIEESPEAEDTEAEDTEKKDTEKKDTEKKDTEKENTETTTQKEINKAANISTRPSVAIDMAALWQPVKAAYIQRVGSMAATLRGLPPGLLEKSERQQLMREAHTLAGSLGTFGFLGVADQCKAIESILQSNAYLSVLHISQLDRLITQVQKTLETSALSLSRGSKDILYSAHHAPTIPANSSTLLADSASRLKPLASPSSIHPFKASHELSASDNYSDNYADNHSQTRLLVINSQTVNNQRSPNWKQQLFTDAANYQVQVQFIDELAQADSAICDELKADIILLDLSHFETLPDSCKELELLAKIQKLPQPLPVVALVAKTTLEHRVRLAHLGVESLLVAPAIPTEILETAMRVSQKGAPPAAKLLIVDDDPEMLVFLKELLLPWGFQLRLLNEPQQFWQAVETFEPDLVMLDVEMPKLSGLDLSRALRSDARRQDIPILFISAYTDAQTIQHVFSAGADDYIRKPIVVPELVVRVLSWLERSRIQRLRREVDSLTGLENTQKSTQSLSRLLSLAQRKAQPLCYILLDANHLKSINERYGHAVGDRVLRHLGKKLRSAFRKEDVIGRWGGEEFVIGLYGTDRREGTAKISQFLEEWQKEQFQVEAHSLNVHDEDCYQEGQQAKGCNPASQVENRAFSVPLRAGIAIYPDDADSLQGLYRAAVRSLKATQTTGEEEVSPKVKQQSAT